MLMILTSCGGASQDSFLKVGESVSDFRLPTLDRERFYLHEQKGKVVVLVFWATWCSSCKVQMPEVDRASAEYDPEALATYHVCTDPKNAGAVMDIVSGLGLQSPVLLDEGSKLFSRFGNVLPTTAVIDAGGTLRLLRQGWSPGIKRELYNLIDGLM
jgi:thiol-disulfide isomerase/thioredoxin